MQTSHPSTNRKPSQEMTGDWIWSARGISEVRDPKKVGKWLVFCSPEYVDTLWNKLATAMENGELKKYSVGCKVNTAGRDNNKHVICVYTANYMNKENIEKCLETLRDLGVGGDLYYKTDNQTRAKQYRGNGVKSSIYSSSDFESPKTSSQFNLI